MAVTVVCALSTCYVLARKLYYAERTQNRRTLERIEGISAVSINGFEDVTEEISGTSFTVKGCPGSEIRTASLYDYEQDGTFYISQIGKWAFRVKGRRHCGVYKESTGQPVKSNYFGGHLMLGPDSPYRKLIPFKADSLQDVVDNYKQFEELLETWPREANPGQVVLSDGTIQYFYVEKQDAEDPS